jgi:DNA-binding response OmpR family regulator
MPPALDRLRRASETDPDRPRNRVYATRRPTHVLIVDDDAVSRMQASQALSALGCEVDEACDLWAARGLMMRTRYDAVFAELYLDDGQGLKIVDAARDGDITPVFCLLGGAGHLPSWALREAGFRGVLRKPVTPESLKAALAALTA